MSAASLKIALDQRHSSGIHEARKYLDVGSCHLAVVHHRHAHRVTMISAKWRVDGAGD
jgi:hypothetical protein